MKKLLVIAALVVFGMSNVNAQFGRQDSQHYAGKNYNQKSRNNSRSVHRINSFQREARENIANGIINGTITSREARRLLESAERIEIKENRYLRNGRLTQREVNDLTRDLERLNREVRKERRDGDRARVDRSRSRY